jgi:hypothetical protein
VRAQPLCPPYKATIGVSAAACSEIDGRASPVGQRGRLNWKSAKSFSYKETEEELTAIVKIPNITRVAIRAVIGLTRSKGKRGV